MPDIKISSVDSHSLPLLGTELFVVVHPVTVPRGNKKVTLDQVVGYSPVQSVNSKTGDVVLNATDVGALASGDNISQLVNDVGYITGGSQPAHHVYIGPESGPNATPGFRTLVASDIPTLPYLTANQEITLSGAVTGSGTTAITTTLANNIVGNTKLRDSQGFSVIGKGDTGTGDPSDIVASNDGDILRRSGSNLAFGSIGIGSITMSTNRLLGRTTASSGPVEEIQVQNALTFSSGILKLGGPATENTAITSSTHRTFGVSMGDGSINTASIDLISHTNVHDTKVVLKAKNSVNSTYSSIEMLGNGVMSIANHSGNGISFDGLGFAFTLGGDSTGDMWYRSGAGRVGRIPPGTQNQVLTMGFGSVPGWVTLPTGSGTVTTVSSGDLSPLFNVSVGTATTTPAFSFAAISQSQRLFYASPVSSSGVPSFRAIDFLDVPRASKEISGSYTILASDLGKILYTTATTTVTLPNGFDTNFEVAVVRGAGSGLVTINAQTALFTINSENTLAYEGAAAVFTHKGSNIWYGMGALGALSVSGSVTNFSALDLSPLFTVSVSAPTSTPELSFTLSNQSQNLVFASPDGSLGAPAFRALLDTDLPNVTITTVPNTNYTPSELDNKKILYFDTASDISFNLPQGSALPVGWSTVVWRSATGGAITFVPQGTATFEGAGSVMNFTKTSVVIVHRGNGVYLASGAVGDFGSSGGSGGHVIKNNATVLTNRPNLNFTNGFSVDDLNPDTTVRIGGTLSQSIILSGDAGQYGITFDNLSQFKAQTQNANNIDITSSSVSIRSSNSSISINTSNSIILNHNSSTRRLVLDSGGMSLDIGSDSTGDIYYRNSSGRFTRLAAVGTGNALISQGTTTAPTYGKIGLTTHVTGTLPVANGGTGLINYAQGDVLYASVANTLSRLAKGTANQILGMNNTATIPEYKTVSNGLTSASGTLKLGGALTANTNLSGNFFFTIGSTSPGYKFEVQATQASQGIFAAKNLNGNSLLQVTESSGSSTAVINTSFQSMLLVDSKGIRVSTANIISEILHVFTANATNPSIRLSAFSGTPSSTANGGMWYNNNNHSFSVYRNSTVNVLPSVPVPTSGQDQQSIRWDNGTGAWEYYTPGGGGGDGQGVTSVTLTQPAAGITISSSGVAITTTGTRTFGLANDLAALEGLGGTGIAVRTASDTWAQRTITSGTGIAVSNGSGVSGNPQISLSHLGIQSLTSPGSDRIMFWDQSGASMQWLSIGSGLTLSGTTLSASGGGSGTVTSVGITPPTSGITVSGSPVTSSGNITLALNNDLLALENLGSTGFAVRTANNTWAQRTLGAGTGIAITNNNGVSGNPSIALDSNFVNWGSYTPTATAFNHIASVSSVSIAHYMRIGDQVHVYGSLVIDPDESPGDVGIVYLTIPIASDFNAFNSDCVGYVNEWSTGRNPGLVLPEISSNRVALMFKIDRTDSTTYFYTYTYTIK